MPRTPGALNYSTRFARQKASQFIIDNYDAAQDCFLYLARYNKPQALKFYAQVLKVVAPSPSASRAEEELENLEAIKETKKELARVSEEEKSKVNAEYTAILDHQVELRVTWGNEYVRTMDEWGEKYIMFWTNIVREKLKRRASLWQRHPGNKDKDRATRDYSTHWCYDVLKLMNLDPDPIADQWEQTIREAGLFDVPL